MAIDVERQSESGKVYGIKARTGKVYHIVVVKATHERTRQAQTTKEVKHILRQTPAQKENAKDIGLLVQHTHKTARIVL